MSPATRSSRAARLTRVLALSVPVLYPQDLYATTGTLAEAATLDLEELQRDPLTDAELLKSLPESARRAEATAAYLRGQESFRAGKPVTAAREFLRASALFPEDPDLLNNAGAGYAQAGNSPVAMEFFRKALAIAPGHRAAAANLARAQLAQGDPRGAAETCRNALLAGGGRDKALSLLHAIAVHRSAEYTRCIDIYEEVRRDHGDSAGVLNNLGACQAMAGREADARASFNRALEIAPAHQEASRNLALLDERA